MDAERLAAANKQEESSFKYDNPLYANDPKKTVVEEVTEVVETTASETESTPTEEA